MRVFDKRFGDRFLESVPRQPGVYLCYSESSAQPIYVGKAKNLRRRLSQYRNAKRRKKHHKMRAIVAEASRIEFQVCPDEAQALILERRLIQKLRPKWNVDGAFYFLYPMLGIQEVSGVTRFCYTTSPQDYPEYEFHGAYRSRHLTGEAFFALMKLLGYVGHRIRKKAIRQRRHSYEFSFRRLPQGWKEELSSFFRGESSKAMETLVLSLVENAQARFRSREVQDQLNSIKRFWRHEAVPLLRARDYSGFNGFPVPQVERDPLLLAYRYRPKASRIGIQS